MTTGPGSLATAGRRRRIAALTVAFGVAILALVWLRVETDIPVQGPTVGEKLSALVTERATLQAQADGETRIDLVSAFRVASLLTDALVVRLAGVRERAFGSLPATRQNAFAKVDALNEALREALAKPGEGARRAARAEGKLAQASLDRLAGDGKPLVLEFSPRFVPPRRAAGELRLVPNAATAPPGAAALPLGVGTKASDRPEVPVVPRYAPAFAEMPTDDPPVEIEVAALGFDDGDAPPVLSIGSWRGQARVSPLRLRFAVPRSAFATDAVRTRFVTGSLAVRHATRTDTFDLVFVVLPDRPGSFAFDQRVRTMVPEANTLVSPEVLARAPAGETKTVRRCFDPPPGTHFDKTQRRVVEIERLGWLNDVSDTTLNEGTVEFATDEKPQQICVVVTARPVTKEARTATIGRFEATLVRDRPDEKAVKSGVRALGWQEAVRIPFDADTVEWKLYVQLFGEINREFDKSLHGDAPLPVKLPFLRIDRDKDGNTLVLRADPSAEP